VRIRGSSFGAAKVAMVVIGNSGRVLSQLEGR
jgi:hypothetical protein